MALRAARGGVRLGRPPKVRWPLLVCGAALVVAGQRRRALGLTRLQATGVVAAAPPMVAAAIERGRIRSAATWLAQMLAYEVAFEAPIDRRAELRERLRVDYPIRADTVLGFGSPPGRRLQRALRHPPRISALDRAMSLIYAAWDIEPHLALLYLLLCRPDRFLRAAGRLAATYDLTLLGYWLSPTAPPWWSSEKLGRMDGDVRRVVIETKRELRGQSRPVDEHELGTNPWASMPSDHFATALMTGLVLREANPQLGAAALAYAAMLGTALVYTGEHYVIDLVAGAGLAAAVYALEPLARPMAGRIAASWPAPGPERARKGLRRFR